MDSPSPLDQIRPPLDFQASSRQNDVNLAYNEQKYILLPINISKPECINYGNLDIIVHLDINPSHSSICKV